MNLISKVTTISIRTPRQWLSWKNSRDKEETLAIPTGVVRARSRKRKKRTPSSTNYQIRMPLHSSRWTLWCSTTIRRATSMSVRTRTRLSLSSMANLRTCSSRQEARKSIHRRRRRCKASKIPNRSNILSQATRNLSAISIKGKMRWNRWLSLQSVLSHLQWNTACCSTRSRIFARRWMSRPWARSSLPERSFCRAMAMRASRRIPIFRTRAWCSRRERTLSRPSRGLQALPATLPR